MALKISINSNFENQYPNGVQPPRRKTGLRVILENMTAIYNNYDIREGLNFSDIYGRMYFKEFSQWLSENGRSEVLEELIKGWYLGIKIRKVVKGEGFFGKQKTRVGDLLSTGDASNVRDIVLEHVKDGING